MELRRPPGHPIQWKAWRRGKSGVAIVEAQLWFEARAKAEALLPGDAEVIAMPVTEGFRYAFTGVVLA